MLAARRGELLLVPGVVAVGEGEADGRRCVAVLVERATPDVAAALPDEIDGYPVSVRESGPLAALDDGRE